LEIAYTRKVVNKNFTHFGKSSTDQSLKRRRSKSIFQRVVSMVPVTKMNGLIRSFRPKRQIIIMGHIAGRIDGPDSPLTCGKTLCGAEGIFQVVIEFIAIDHMNMTLSVDL